jgi:glycosyltransferase involved in cell wall biosynthesis
MKISVAVRTKFHAFQIAEQLHQNGHLHRLYTSYYGSFLGKSNCTGFHIPPHQVRENYLTAFFYYVLRQESLKVNEWFGSRVAEQIGEEDLIAAWSLIAKPIFEQATHLGIKKVLVHPSAHVLTHKAILEEEYNRLGIDKTKLFRSFSAARIDFALTEYDLADRIQVPSQFVADTFTVQGYSQKKLIQAPLGVDMQIFQRPADTPYPQNFTLIYVGSISVRKGVLPLLAALQALNLPQTKLLLIGQIDEEIKEKLVIYQKYYEYLGVIPQKDLKNYLLQSSVFVINSLEDGFAQVVPQAMACGLPVICTNHVGAADCVIDGQNGFIVPINNAGKLKEKIVFFYENREQIAVMGQAALQSVKKQFSWREFGDRIIQFYQEILAMK